MNSDKAIFTATMVTLGSTVSRSMLPTKYGGMGKTPDPKLLIGTGLAFVGLSILGDISPKLAVPLAASVAITAATYYGFPILNCVFNDNCQETK